MYLLAVLSTVPHEQIKSNENRESYWIHREHTKSKRYKQRKLIFVLSSVRKARHHFMFDAIVHLLRPIFIFLFIHCFWHNIHKIFHWSPMQTEKSQTNSKRIMPETKFAEFPEFSVNPRVGISRSASATEDRFFFLPTIGSFYKTFVNYFSLNVI